LGKEGETGIALEPALSLLCSEQRFYTRGSCPYLGTSNRKEIKEMELTSKNSFQRFFRKKRLLVALLAMALCIGGVSAAVYTMYLGTGTATVKSPDIQLVAGADAAGGTSDPKATVTIASTKDFATVGFSIFPSVAQSPSYMQPTTTYEDLLEIKNVGSSQHTINWVMAETGSGASNLGQIRITPYAMLENGGRGMMNPIILESSTDKAGSNAITIPAGGTIGLQVSGWAKSDAAVDATVVFTIAISWS
jgi:hypothetical protein